MFMVSRIRSLICLHTQCDLILAGIRECCNPLISTLTNALDQIMSLRNMTRIRKSMTHPRNVLCGGSWRVTMEPCLHMV